MTADAERLAAITPGSWDELIALAGKFAAENDALRARINAARWVYINVTSRFEAAVKMNAALAGGQPEATPALCRVCGNPRQESGHPECPSSHAEDTPEPNEEEFCGRCFAGVDSDEHHGKCVVTGHAEMGESAPEPGCKCDGATYRPEQEHPFLVHPDCPRHSTPEPPHLDPEPMTWGKGRNRHPLTSWCEVVPVCHFDPRPADENGKAYSKDRAHYGVQS